jgi:hypothetical protein
MEDVGSPTIDNKLTSCNPNNIEASSPLPVGPRSLALMMPVQTLIRTISTEFAIVSTTRIAAGLMFSLRSKF